MKVTALIPDELIVEVRQLSKGKNITESLIIALKEWSAMKKIKVLNEELGKKPLQFDVTSSTLSRLSRRL
jgi:hypothetical protein